jgi:hypothetical protein
MQKVELEQLPKTGDHHDFRATVLDDAGLKGTFSLEISDSNAVVWCVSGNIAKAAQALANEIGMSVVHSSELAGRRFRFAYTPGIGTTVDETVVAIREDYAQFEG